jgi:hypothetical protein
LFDLTWARAFIIEFSSTREGIPFWDYFYTGSTEGREPYIPRGIIGRELLLGIGLYYGVLPFNLGVAFSTVHEALQ